ncbi:MAG: hypothetical protein JXR96_23650 [Deltaproteobacteria bacterium]|nr:hypothetical protein [Deltaproteobacteria bacterium]
MFQSLRKLVLSIGMIGPAVACVAGLAVGLWTLLGDGGPGTLLLRGGAALLLISLAAAIVVLLALHVLRRAFGQVQELAKGMARGERSSRPRLERPEELMAIVDSLLEADLAFHHRERSLEQEFRSRSRQERTEALKRFAEGVAREIQQPLAGVVGFAELALRQQGVAGQLKNYLSFIEQEARSGRESLESLLRYCREESAATEPVDINGLLMEAAKGLRTGQDVKLRLNLSEDLPPLMANPGELARVFTTLLDNAREALEQDKGTIELSTNRDEQGRVVIMVRDDGRGIPEHIQARVFTPFFSTKGLRKGAGMNLALAERTVRRHGGEMDFWSRPAEGTVFFVHLPIRCSEADGV